MIKNYFKLSDKKTTVGREFQAALIGFFTLIYVVIINAQVLSNVGISYATGIIASILATVFGTFIVGLFLNLPFQVAPAMGINAFIAYGLISSGTLSAKEAFTAVSVSGAIVMIVSLTPIIQYLDQSISSNFKNAIRSGIGLYLILLGLESANVIKIDKNEFLKMNSLTNIGVVVVLLLLILGIVLKLKDIKINYLILIIVGSIICHLLNLSQSSNISTAVAWGDYNKFIFPITQSGFSNSKFWGAVISLSLTIIFETLGTVPQQLEEVNEQTVAINKVSFFVGVSSLFAGFFGTTSTISALESDAAITSGGKTGLTNIFIGIFFLGTLLLLPIYSLVASLATMPVLILIGINMFQSITAINISQDKPDIFASILFITMIPFTFSITNGMGIAFIFYFLVKLCLAEFKSISKSIVIISILYALMFIIQIFS